VHILLKWVGSLLKGVHILLMWVDSLLLVGSLLPRTVDRLACTYQVAGEHKVDFDVVRDAAHGPEVERIA